MATDWQPLSELIGRIGGIASRSLYQNVWLPEPKLPVSFQCKTFKRSGEYSRMLL